MALARLNRKKETTLADHNCAFNAFALGLCDKFLLREIESLLGRQKKSPDVCFKAFISIVTPVLNVAENWVSVKSALLDLRQKNPEKLQVVLARILRTLSIDLALQPDEEEYHYQQTIHLLLAAFSYKQNPNLYGDTSEDIFSRHPFIMREFKDATEASLLKWWKDEGYRKFLRKMNKDRVWAGDIELTRLARYFELVLESVTHGNLFTLYGNFGRFPSLDGAAGENIDESDKDKIKLALYNRDVLRRPEVGGRNDGVDEFVIHELTVIFRHIDEVPDYKIVNQFVECHAHELSKLPVPKEWSSVCISELLHRAVIEGNSKSGYRFTVMDIDRIRTAINAIPSLESVKQIIRKYYIPRPQMVLVNDEGKHWENTLLIDEPKFNLLPVVGYFSVGQMLQPMILSALSSNTESRRNDQDVVKRKT